MKFIYLTQGKKTKVDDEDFQLLSQYKWHVTSGGYAATNIKNGTGYKYVKMHRLLMNPSQEFEIDHINRDALDNRKANLRIVTHQQNMFNRGPVANTSSKFRGVSWIKREKKWLAQLSYMGKQLHLGYFDDEVAAAKQFNLKAKQLFGKFTSFNTFKCQ